MDKAHYLPERRSEGLRHGPRLVRIPLVNIAAHPDQVWIEFGGKQIKVTLTQLDGGERAQACQRITQSQVRGLR